jgi:hypothetical protein
MFFFSREPKQSEVREHIKCEQTVYRPKGELVQSKSTFLAVAISPKREEFGNWTVVHLFLRRIMFDKINVY